MRIVFLARDVTGKTQSINYVESLVANLILIHAKFYSYLILHIQLLKVNNNLFYIIKGQHVLKISCLLFILFYSPISENTY